VEAVRRTIARALALVCGVVEAALTPKTRAETIPEKDAASVHEAAEALRQAQVFLADVAGPPETDDEQRRLTSTLHALDHASRLAESAQGIDFGAVRAGPVDDRAGQLCADAMQIATSLVNDIAILPGIDHAQRASPNEPGAKTLPNDAALAQLERCATELERLQRTDRSTTLGAVANGTLTADAAIVRVDAVRNLQALAWHAWRSTAHLVGPGD
jgi:phosphate:Na+ symporter